MITVMGELLSMSMNDNNDAIDHLKPQKRKNKSNISEYHLFSLREGKVKCYLSSRKHGRGTRGAAPASDAVARASDRVCVFFFFFSDSRRLGSIRADAARFAPMRLDSCRIGFNLRRIGLIRPKSGRIGHIGSYRPTADTAEIGRKTAGTGRKRSETAEIGLEYGCQSRNLHSSFFFCESRHSLCFLRIF